MTVTKTKIMANQRHLFYLKMREFALSIDKALVQLGFPSTVTLPPPAAAPVRAPAPGPAPPAAANSMKTTVMTKPVTKVPKQVTAVKASTTSSSTVQKFTAKTTAEKTVPVITPSTPAPQQQEGAEKMKKISPIHPVDLHGPSPSSSDKKAPMDVIDLTDD